MFSYKTANMKIEETNLVDSSNRLKALLKLQLQV